MDSLLYHRVPKASGFSGRFLPKKTLKIFTISFDKMKKFIDNLLP